MSTEESSPKRLIPKNNYGTEEEKCEHQNQHLRLIFYTLKHFGLICHDWIKTLLSRRYYNSPYMSYASLVSVLLAS